MDGILLVLRTFKSTKNLPPKFADALLALFGDVCTGVTEARYWTGTEWIT